jgi:hypothetical protein
VSPRGNGRRLRVRGTAVGVAAVAAPVIRPLRGVVSVVTVAACITPPPGFA